MLKVPAAYSSQECSECEHTHAGNRSDQTTFVCQGCGYQAHADFNASRVIKKRGLKLLEAGISDKPKKQTSIRRKPEYKTECGTGAGRPSVELPRKTSGNQGFQGQVATNQEASPLQGGVDNNKQIEKALKEGL